MSFNTNETIKSLNEHEKAEIQMKFISKYKEIFYLLEKCNFIDHTDLVFFGNISDRTARRFTNEYLDRRIVKINNKITVLNKNNESYSKASENDEIYKELIERLKRKQSTILRLKNRAFYLLNSDNREVRVSTNKIDNSLARAIEYKLKKESDLEENIQMKEFLNQALRERKKILDEDIKEKNKELLNKDNILIDENEYYKLVQIELINQGYNPSEFFNRFILKKIEINNSTAIIHLNYIFKERSDNRIARDIDIALATIELLRYKNYKNIDKSNIKVNLQIYSTICLNIAHIEKTIKHGKRVMNSNYHVLEDQVFTEEKKRYVSKESGKLYLFYTTLFNQDNKYFIYDEIDKCFKLYY